jgi:hypothetical protein
LRKKSHNSKLNLAGRQSCEGDNEDMFQYGNEFAKNKFHALSYEVRVMNV